MPISVSRVIADIQSEFSDAQRTDTLRFVNIVFRDLCAEFPISIATRMIALTAACQNFPLLEQELSIQAATYYGTSGFTDWNVLDMSMSVDDKDEIDINWRNRPPQRPMEGMVWNGELWLDPMPNATTPFVQINPYIVAASNQSPVVYTLSAPYCLPDNVTPTQFPYQGLTTSQVVTVAGVTGNTSANGTFPIQVLSPTTFLGLTPPGGSAPAGNGAYVSGGTVSVPSYPNVTVWSYWYPGDLGFNDQLPVTIRNHRVLVEGVCFHLAARKKDANMIAFYAAQFEKETDALERFIGRRDRRYKNQVYPENLALPVI